MRAPLHLPPAASLLALALALAAASCSASGAASAASDPPPRPAPPLAGPGISAGANPSTLVPRPPTGASGAPETSTSTTAAPTAADTPAGWIAGRPLTIEEILIEWQRTAPREVFLIVEKLVAARLAFAEADRLGIRLQPEVVEAETAAQIARFKADVAKDAPPGVGVDEYLRGALGVEPERHWEGLRDGVIRQMLAERAVRAFALERENASVRLIVVPTEAEAKAVADELAAGGDFAELAREKSVDESSRDGGLVPFLVRQESSPLARVVFAAEPGEVIGPLPAAGHHFLVRVEERRAALEGGWSALEPAVEQSLRLFPVEESEFLHWKLELERRYPVDLAPLMRRLGASRAPSAKPREP